MEEAYNELYQQFLRLRSLCLRQAALLHQLTNALQRHQGDAVHNGDLGDMMSIPVQCTHEIPAYLHESPQLLEATEARRGANCLYGNAATFPDLLAEDISKLCVDVSRQRKEDGTLEQKATALFGTGSARCQGASSDVSKDQRQADHGAGDGPRHVVKVGVPPEDGVLQSVLRFHHVSEIRHMSRPACLCQTCDAAAAAAAEDSPSLVGDSLIGSGGLLMSDVALQSHICEFCQAVFPGDTTTRGEFLRHLYTHVT